MKTVSKFKVNLAKVIIGIFVLCYIGLIVYGLISNLTSTLIGLGIGILFGASCWAVLDFIMNKRKMKNKKFNNKLQMKKDTNKAIKYYKNEMVK